MTGIGTGGFIFAKTCGKPFILLVYSEKWASSSCHDLLQAYCLYCCFMALNGILEAYAFSKGTDVTLKKLRWLMVLNSVGYIGLSYGLSVQIGIVGLVYANCLNMLLRTISCLYFTFRQFGKDGKEAFMLLCSVFTGKIYLGLVALAWSSCYILENFALPLLLK